MVYRDSGRRPKARHRTLASAQEEARRVATQRPGSAVWVIECRTVETHRVEVRTVLADAGVPTVEGDTPD